MTKLRRARRRSGVVVWFLFGHNQGLMEAVNGIVAITWGIWVGNPWWSVFPISTAYEAFRVLPEWAWGVLTVGLGVTQVVAVGLGSWRLRRWAAFAMSFLWLFIATAFVLGDYRATATVIYPFLVIGSARHFLTLKLYSPANHET